MNRAADSNRKKTAAFLSPKRAEGTKYERMYIYESLQTASWSEQNGRKL